MIPFRSALLDQLFKVIFIAPFGLAQLVVFERAPDGSLDVPEIKRLRNVIESASAHGFNGALDSVLAADHHNHRVGRTL